MVVSRQPFTRTARIVASLLGAICLTSGGVGLALGIPRHRVVLSLAAAGICALGALYFGAAWRGRPWRWP